MKILHVIPRFVPSELYGGAEMVVYQLSKALIKKGHEVTVYTSNLTNLYKEIPINSEIVEDIKIKRFNNLNTTLSKMTKLMITPSMSKALDKEINKFDIVNLHEGRSFQNLLIHKYSLKRGVPYIVHPHACYIKEGVYSFSFLQLALSKFFDLFLRHKVLRDASMIIALNKTEVHQYKSMNINEEKIEIVPNGIDPAQYEDLPERGKFRKEYGFDNCHKIVLYLGRIERTKGIDILAKSFSKILVHMNNAKLVIVGKDDGYLGTLRKMVKELNIEQSVLFTGSINEMDKLKAYVDSDVYVLFRSWEPFGITLLESCACGTPVICSKGCGIADIIDGQAGLAIPYNEDHLANALLSILSNEKLRQDLGKRGRSMVLEHFTWQKTADQMEEIYTKCI